MADDVKVADTVDPKKSEEEQKKQEQNSGIEPTLTKVDSTNPACSISLNNVFIQLHLKALEVANPESKELELFNTAVEGKDDKAKFYGAGTHAIFVKSKSLEVQITREDALETLLKYIQVFLGPDIKISADQLWPLQTEDTNNKEEPTKESKLPNSFLSYLLTEADPTKPNEDPEGSDQEDTDTQNDTTDTATEDKDAGKTEKEEKPDESPKEEKAAGWSFKYDIDIKGQPKKDYSTVDTLKKLAGKFLGGFALASFDFKSGTKTDGISLGELKDKLSEIFGKIDPDQFKSSYDANIKKKFQKTQASSEIWDTKTILQHLKNRLKSKDKPKIKEAEYAICTKVTKKDPGYKLFSKSTIAEVMTNSIKGIFKKFKNQVKPDDVILVNNYDENEKENGRETGEVADSIIRNYDLYRLITEEGEESKKEASDDSSTEKVINEVQKKLQEFANKELPDSEAKVETTKKIIEYLKAEGVDYQKTFDGLNTYATFVLKYQYKQDKNNEELKDSLIVKKFYDVLFEEKDDKSDDDKKKKENEDKSKLERSAQNIFRKLIDSFKDRVKDPKKIDYSAIDNIKSVSINNQKNESLIRKTSSLLIDLFEKSNKDKSRDHITNDQAKELIGLVKDIGLKHIQDNFDQVEKKWSEVKQGQSEFSFKKYEPIHSDVEKLLKSKEDDGEKVLIDYINSAIHDKSEEAKKKKIVLIRLIPALKNLPEKSTTIKVKFIFKDPNEQKPDKELETIETEPGEIKEEDFPEAPKEAGYKFKEWSPDPNSLKEDGEVYAEYEEETNEESDETIKCIFIDVDPENPDDESKQKTIDEKEFKSADEIEYPELSEEHKGWKFDKWEPSIEDLKKDFKAGEIAGKQIIKTSYVKDEKEESSEGQIQTIYYIVPDTNEIIKDPTKSKAISHDVKHTDTDFYIVPMKGLGYKKKENDK